MCKQNISQHKLTKVQKLKIAHDVILLKLLQKKKN